MIFLKLPTQQNLKEGKTSQVTAILALCMAPITRVSGHLIELNVAIFPPPCEVLLPLLHRRGPDAQRDRFIEVFQHLKTADTPSGIRNQWEFGTTPTRAPMCIFRYLLAFGNPALNVTKEFVTKEGTEPTSAKSKVRSSNTGASFSPL